MNRCSTCAHWQGPTIADRGDCNVVGVSVSLSATWPGPHRTLTTRADFGCVHHSAGVASDTAHARSTDPETAHEAARSVDRLNPRRLDVLRTLDRPMIDLRLVAAYGESRYGETPTVHAQSASGIRSRRAELVQLGLVAHVDTIRVMKRRHRVWQRTPAGDAAARTGRLP